MEEGDDAKMKLLFYAPRFGHPDEAGNASPEFEIDADSAAGRRIKEAVEARQNPRKPAALPNIDPEGLIRLRVKIRRIDNEDGRSFEVEELMATNWLSAEVPEKMNYSD